MQHLPEEVRLPQELTDALWPAATHKVAAIGDAWVATTVGDFVIDDFHLVRRQFPGRHVTLDGDVITVWPRTPALR
ncbi:hypothetical protein ACF08B_39490 [Streptomyces sp. NPDC015139]|uniref:hypothetical protein n=1 Tax=Streptomyces sp. NPDC015139 TaxID=3364942 RepID=UPI0036F58047